MARKPEGPGNKTKSKDAGGKPTENSPGNKSPGKKKRAGLKEALEASYRLLRADRLDEAEKILTKVLDAKPDNAQALNLLGMVRSNQGQFDDAITLYGRSLELKPDVADVHNNLGNVLRHLGRQDEAMACYQKVDELAPGSVTIQVNRAKTLAGMGKTEEAQEAFRKVLDDDPENVSALRGLARVEISRGDKEGATKLLRRALEKEPGTPEILNELGLVVENQEEYDEAIALYRRALEAKPDFLGAQVNLGNALRKLENFDEAKAVLEQSLESDADNPATLNSMGILYRDMNREKEAVAFFERAIEIKPDHIEAFNNMGNALRHLNRDEEALAAYDKAIEINPDFMETYINRAKIYHFSADDPELERLKGFLAKDDLSEKVRTLLMFILGKACDDAGLYDEAFANFEQGNKNMAIKEPYDGVRHRASMELTKRMFVRPLAAPKEGPAADERIPIFIVGLSRSGKTITESMLARHPAVFDAGERKEWGDAIDAVRDRHGISDPYPKCLDHMDGEKIRQIGSEYMDLLSKGMPAETRFVVNTLPGNYGHVGLFFLAFPHVRVIYCHRNPLDNFLQVYFYRYRHGNGYSYAFDRMVSYYADYQNIMRHWFGLYGDRILNMEYEKTIDDPVAAARRVYDYCGLDFDPEAVADLELSPREIDHWRHYEPHLAGVRDALMKIIQQEAEAAERAKEWAAAKTAERANKAEQSPEADGAS